MSDPSTERSPPSQRALSVEQQFWQLCRQGRRPDLRVFLSGFPGLPVGDVAAVIAVDQYERWLAGDRIRAESYLPLLPPGPDLDHAVCDIIYGEYLLREQLGEHPSLAEFQARFPAQANLLARQVDLHRALADDSSMSRFPSRAPAPVEPAAPILPGYEILGELGRGGMGVVYKARQVVLDRTVALKVVRIGTESDPQVLDRIRREATTTGRLSHPNIVTVHDAGLVNGLYFVAMEYIDGVDLHRLVEREGPLIPQLACDYIRQTALGLQYAHESGLIHRDIKPSNLIIQRRTGGSDLIKILDLGLARVESPIDSSGPLTQVGAFMGTPDFIAPEQANDPRAAGPQSDLYSLGCTFYYLLAGQAPFGGETPLAKLMQHQLHEPTPLERLRPNLPRPLTDLVRVLMAKRIQDRPASAAAVAQALESLAMATPAVRTAPASPEPATSKILVGHEDGVRAVAFLPSGGQLASGGLDRTVRLWDVASGCESGRIDLPGAVACLAIAPAGDLLVVCDQERQLALWDLVTRRPRWQQVHLPVPLRTLAFSPDGTCILAGTKEGTLQLHETSTGSLLRGWHAHDGPVWSVAVSRDGKEALSGGKDRHLRLWNLHTGESLATSAEQDTLVAAVAIAPSGQRAASGGGMDALVRLWRLPNLDESGVLEGHESRVTALAFSPDGSWIASGSRDHSVRIWAVATRRCLAVLHGHTHWVSSLAWDSLGKTLASASDDHSVRLWPAPSTEGGPHE